ncbi:DUF1501 domain-containing protein [Fimbriiglobus ruber]|uniref:DUF1501 domain-containing protein n=1 Tax=Fimbriiglobus ruber TaxID=1908690 RepID=A0A225D8Z1_9BACT|nr:DUF1501 domain-containing protein [Fimbriiglobus ruber]OWK36114.1 hypothetical protein FRUB_08677 [Fimbriiglobus ruber]
MRTRLDRREWLRAGAGAAVSVSVSGWFGRLAHAAGADPARKRSCVLLWLNGGPATIDLWDLKPGHANGGPSKEIATAAPGLRISEHLPKLAALGDRLAVVRSMSTKEGDHGRATYLIRTGTLPQGAIDFPTLGSLVAKELRDETADLPPFVSVAPQRGLSQNAFGPGFLGPQYAPLIVADGQSAAPGRNGGDSVDLQLKVQNLDHYSGVSNPRADDRLALLGDLEADFLAARPGTAGDSHRTAYQAAARLMKPETTKAFDLSGENPAVRDAYGRNLFGQGCLLARRLVERGVPFVEVTLDGWDTHANNFDSVKNLCGVLDPAWSTLVRDLKDRGLLDSTLIACMGEFGRTPKINPQKGRDHFSEAWSVVLAGGGIQGGQAVGRTSKDGTKVEERPVGVPDVLATMCKALGIDHEKQNLSNVGRPIRIVDQAGKPIREVLA